MIRTNKTEIRKVLLSASSDSTRVHLCCVQFSREKGVLRIVSTDGHRLTVVERADAGADCAIMVPTWLLNAAMHAFDSERNCSSEEFIVSAGPCIEPVIELTPVEQAHKTLVEHSTSARFVAMSSLSSTVYAYAKVPTSVPANAPADVGFGFWYWDRKEEKFWTVPAAGMGKPRAGAPAYRKDAPSIGVVGLDMGAFPSWQQVIPGSQDFTATIDRKAFRKALEKATNVCVELAEKGQVIVHTVTEAFGLVGPCVVGTHDHSDRADPTRVGVLARYAEEAAKVMSVKASRKEVSTFELGMSGSLDPLTFTSSGIRVVVMPMRI